MQLVAGPWSWQLAQSKMSRRAALPWKLRAFVFVPTQPGGWGLRPPIKLPLTPRAVWQPSQVSGV